MKYYFIALDKYGEEAKWLHNFLKDIPRSSKPVLAICIHYDSQSTIEKAHNNIYNNKSRHIFCKNNTIKQLLSIEVIFIDYIRSKGNIANLLSNV